MQHNKQKNHFKEIYKSSCTTINKTNCPKTDINLVYHCFHVDMERCYLKFLALFPFITQRKGWPPTTENCTESSLKAFLGTEPATSRSQASCNFRESVVFNTKKSNAKIHVHTKCAVKCFCYPQANSRANVQIKRKKES